MPEGCRKVFAKELAGCGRRYASDNRESDLLRASLLRRVVPESDRVRSLVESWVSVYLIGR
jgi:hypothetical protein